MSHKMHPNSLANLRLPKEHKPYHKESYKLPQEKVNDLYLQLANGLTIKAAAKEINIAYETARKYFEQGDPKRAIKPLKFRLMILQDKMQTELDTEFMNRRKELVEMVKGVIKKMQEEIRAGAIFKKASLSQFDKLVRLEVYLRGIGQSATRTAGILTAEDIKLLAERDSGKVDSEES